MAFDKPIIIDRIPEHVTSKSGVKLKTVMRQMDRVADGGTSDGKFTRFNFRHIQNLNDLYLKAKSPFAYETKSRFRTFAGFHLFIAKFILSQRCRDPKNWHTKEVVENDRRVKKRTCENFPEPFAPPRIRRRRKRRPKRRQRKALPKPDTSNNNDDILSMRHGARTNVTALKPDKALNLKLSDDALRRVITLPGKGYDSDSLICKNTRKGPKCTMGGALMSMQTLCAKHRGRLPEELQKRCPTRKPNLASIMKGICPGNKGCMPCITKAQLRNLKKNNMTAYRAFMSTLRPHILVLNDCLPRCDGTTPIKPKRVNPDGTVTFRKPKRGLDITLWLMKARGEDHLAPQKLRYLDRTRAKRLKMRKRWNRRIEEVYFVRIDGRLLKIWQRKDLSYAAKRQILFELWDECLEDNGSERTKKVQRARAAIIRFIKKKLPQGSPRAYTAQELKRTSLLRAGKTSFNPYDS